MSSSEATTCDDLLFNVEKFNKYITEQIKIAPKLLLSNHVIKLEIDEEDDMEFFIQKAEQDLRETPEIMAQSIKELKELLAEEPDLRVPHTDLFYRIFLRRCKWYAPSAFSLMKRYFRFRQNYPHIFNELVPTKQKEAFCAGLTYPSPVRCKDGCRILIIEMGKKWKPKEVSLNQLFKGLIICIEAVMIEPKTQIAGGRTIIDLEGFSLSQASYFSPSFAKMVVDFIQKVIPLRTKSIHIINQPILFNMVFALFKPFFEEKIRKRIHFHGTDRESLINFVGKKVLFKKYGGELDDPPSDTNFGYTLWQYFCMFDELFEDATTIGYTNKK